MKNNSENTITIVGHAHVDAVWLWDHDETKDVLEDTFTRILDLMDLYPDVTFVQTMAQYNLWMENEYPEIDARIERMVKANRWQIVGGMWVESDCNIPDGESLCRQMLYGQQYYQEKYGFICKAAWLPDTFGFCWTFPTMLKAAGMEYFFTSKLVWQSKLPFPHLVFDWRGPDGSEVLGYQTVRMYNNIDVHDIHRQAVRFYTQVDYPIALLPYGEGDHGGGLRVELIESVHNDTEPNKVSFGHAEEYFKTLAANKEQLNLPLVEDELYLNTHQGTLTSQAWIKRENRYAEVRLNTAEKLEVLTILLGEKVAHKHTYRNEWRTVLLHQFHDALPGTAIRKAYEDAAKDYLAISKTMESDMNENLLLVSRQVNTEGFHNPLLLYNSLAWDRRGYVERDGLAMVVEIPALGYRVIERQVSREEAVYLAIDGENITMDNGLYTVKISQIRGVIESFIPAFNTVECVGEAGLGVFELFEDFTTQESAWNICRGRDYSLSIACAPKLICDTPLKKGVQVTFSFADSDQHATFTVTYYAIAEDPILRCHLETDWHVKYKSAQVRFSFAPTEEETTYQIPYGSMVRKDHQRSDANPYDRERFEVAAHRWAATKLAGKQVAMVIFNDTKYGFAQEGSSLRMSLLRSPLYPDPSTMGLEPINDGHTDQGTHYCEYGIAAFDANVSMTELHRRAGEFTTPVLDSLVDVQQGSLPSTFGLIKSQSEGIFIHVLKVSEDGEAFIVRLIESEGIDRRAVITFGREVQTAFYSSILEEEGDACEVSGKSVKIDIGHNAIQTLRLKFKR